MSKLYEVEIERHLDDGYSHLRVIGSRKMKSIEVVTAEIPVHLRKTGMRIWLDFSGDDIAIVGGEDEHLTLKARDTK